MTRPRDLLAQARHPALLAAADTTPPEDPAYPEVRLAALRAEVLRGRVAAARELAERTPLRALDEDYRTVLGLWQVFLGVLHPQDATPATLGEAGRRLAEAAADPALGPAAHAEALGLQTRCTIAMVRHDELPRTALRQAASLAAAASDAYRDAGLPRDAWAFAERRCLLDHEAGSETVAGAVDALGALAADAADDALGAGLLRLARFRLDLPRALAEAEDLKAECAAVAELLTAGGHACGEHLALWAAVKQLLVRGSVVVVPTAEECAAEFGAVGAVHWEHEVWNALAVFHTLRGDGAAHRVVRARYGGSAVQWPLSTAVHGLTDVDTAFRMGDVDRAERLLDELFSHAPHRQGRVALRVLRSSMLGFLRRDADARAHLRAALADLEPVAPTPLTPQVLAQLAHGEPDPAAALDFADRAVAAARALGPSGEVGDHLVHRAHIRARLNSAAGRACLSTDVQADLDAAVAEWSVPSPLARTQVLVAAHQARGFFLVQDGRLDEAHEVLEGAVRMADEAGLGLDAAFTRFHQATVEVLLARERRSTQLYDAASAVLRRSRDGFLRADTPQSAWEPLFMSANAQWEAARIDGDPARVQRALEHLTTVDSEIDALRGVVGGGSTIGRQLSAMGFVQDKQQVYQTGFRIAVHGLGDTALGLEWLERMKSRALLDALAAAVPPTADATPAPCAEQEADRGAAGYAALRRSRPPSWEEVRALLRRERRRHGRKVAVLQYYVDGDQAVVFGLDPDQGRPLLARVAVDLADLDRFAETTFRLRGGVRTLMDDFADGGAGAWQSFAPLVAAARDWTAPDDVVYLVPYGPLHDLPLHTLHVEPGIPLGVRNPVCYVPSLAVLAHVLGGERGSGPPFAVFGDPDGTLPRALEEAHAVAAAVGAEALTGSAATRAALTRALSSSAAVHVAAHAKASVVDGLSSGVKMADGTVTATDLLTVAVRADLVVLSCCETGVSQHRPGDEAVGLVRALLHSGARTVLTTQWQVNDESARAVLTAFHRADPLLPRAEALRAALSAMTDTHFYHWGGYVLAGDWR
ncbi:CHAT domain-containing protein [Saccharothrix xinjiangensis]|uniref:CHAT domain-containing protein n=1 Tax=Saccharothrix xinjiangensis TaxID=204798 RepID=A0ABV9Y239_9PSEU